MNININYLNRLLDNYEKEKKHAFFLKCVHFYTGDSETSKNGCPYDKEEMRKFIKQRQKERYEKIFQENRLKENEKKEKIKKLELLKQTQKKIIDNSKMRCPIRSMVSMIDGNYKASWIL